MLTKIYDNKLHYSQAVGGEYCNILTSESIGKLRSLNNLVGVFEAEWMPMVIFMTEHGNGNNIY